VVALHLLRFLRGLAKGGTRCWRAPYSAVPYAGCDVQLPATQQRSDSRRRETSLVLWFTIMRDARRFSSFCASIPAMVYPFGWALCLARPYRLGAAACHPTDYTTRPAPFSTTPPLPYVAAGRDDDILP